MKGYVYITGTGADPAGLDNISDPLFGEMPTLGACMSIPLASLNEAGLLEFLEDTPLDADKFLEFVAEHKLGDGEAECIMLAELSETTIVCSDDMRGRRKAEAILGQGRCVGTLKLLKQAVAEGLLPADHAFAAYELMKDAGGFLPEIGAGYFSPDP